MKDSHKTQLIGLEELEDRIVPSIGPSTPWHFTLRDNFAHGSYLAPGDPGSVGFTLADVYNIGQVNGLPPGVKALVWVGKTNGADSDFINYVRPFIGNPNVYGFYLADEPDPATVPAANLQAESDFIHANFPGAKTFITLLNYQGYTPANTHIDLVGLDPYPVRTWGVDYSSIPNAFYSALALGWSREQIVPVYQAFGGSWDYAVPTAEQEETMLAIWGKLTPNPAFDYAYSWGEWHEISLVDLPYLQEVFREHNTNSFSPLAKQQELVAIAIDQYESLTYRALALLDPKHFAFRAAEEQAELSAHPLLHTPQGQWAAAMGWTAFAKAFTH